VKDILTDPKSVKISYDLKPEFSEKSIKNIITKTSMLSVSLNPKFSDETGKEISYCQIAAPGITGKKLEAIFAGDAPYAGFISGSLNDSRDKNWSCDVDLSKEVPKCNFIVSPNDKKKYVGVTGEIKEKIKLKADNNEADAEITLLPVTTGDMKMDIQMSGPQVQDGSTKAVKIKIADIASPTEIVRVSIPDSKDSKDKEEGLFKVTAQGTAVKQSESPAKQITFSAKTGQSEEFGYRASKLSNTNFLELAGNAKDMSEFQLDGLKKVVLDTLAAYGDQASSAKQEEKFRDFMSSAQSASRDFMNLKKKVWRVSLFALSKGYDANETIKNFKDVRNSDTLKSASFLESFSETAVLGLNFLDLGAGLLMLAPSKIPVFGPRLETITAPTQAAFSLALNIWKGMFQDLAAGEKLDRVKEFFHPVKMRVIAQDISGWTLEGFPEVQVAYALIQK